MSFYDSLSDAQKLYTMYLIGPKVSGGTWDYCNQQANYESGNGAKLGFMCWGKQTCGIFTGTYAFDFVSRMSADAVPDARDVWKVMGIEWEQAVEYGTAYPLWNSNIAKAQGMFTLDMATAWTNAVKLYKDEAIAYQEWYWCEQRTFSGNLYDLLESCTGNKPDSPTLDEVKVIFFEACCRFALWVTHQTDAYFSKGLGLDELWQKFREQYAYIYGTNKQQSQTALDYIDNVYYKLKDWDGVTVPQFGQLAGYGDGSSGDGASGGNGGEYGVVGTGTDGNTTQVQTFTKNVTYLDFYGESICIHFKSGEQMLCYRSMANNCWVPNSGSISSSSSSSSSSGSYMPSDVLNNVIQYNIDSNGLYTWSVSGDVDYMHPETSGYTNCSAWIVWCAQKFAPDSEMANCGAYTGDMANTGARIASGGPSDPFPYDKARPGDVLLVCHSEWNPNYDHVELFLGTEAQGNYSGSELWGAGSVVSGNPHPSGYASSYITGEYCWALQRISWGDTTSGDWVETNFTTYNENFNEVNGWNSYEIGSDGMCVAVPWNDGNVPPNSNCPDLYYGVILELEIDGKQFYTCVADCGNFGPGNTYNNDVLIDLQPGIWQQLGGSGRYSGKYRVCGYIQSDPTGGKGPYDQYAS